MFSMTPDEQAQRHLNNKLRAFFEAMVNLVYWYHEPLIEAYKRIEQLEARNHELRMMLEAIEKTQQTEAIGKA